MIDSLFRKRKFRFLVRLVTALSFALFTAYQIFLTSRMEATNIGRMIGVALYFLMTVAAVLDFFHMNATWTARCVLLVIGLFLLFAFRLTNAAVIFANLSFSYIPSVLNLAVYIFTQLGTLALAFGYIIVKSSMNEKRMYSLIRIMVPVVIALYVLSFIAECVMLIGYRINIDFSMKLTLISRLLYCVAFVGTAVSLMLKALIIGGSATESKSQNTTERMIQED